MRGREGDGRDGQEGKHGTRANRGRVGRQAGRLARETLPGLSPYLRIRMGLRHLAH